MRNDPSLLKVKFMEKPGKLILWIIVFLMVIFFIIFPLLAIFDAIVGFNSL